VPYTNYPEVVPASVPEKHDADAPIPAGVLPPPFSEVDTGPHQLDGDETTVADTAVPVVWWRRKRNRLILLAAVIAVLLIVIGVSVGVGVPLSRKNR
jgi:hypothetical protein